MNILQISEALKGVPKDFLVREATMPSGNYPQYLVVSELSRRTAMEKQFAGIAAQQNQPQETVADRTVREATPMPMAAMQGLKSPQTTYQEEPSGQETMGVPAAVRMFEGGRVAFNEGGLGEDGVDRSFLGGIYDRVKSGVGSAYESFLDTIGTSKVPRDIPYGTPEYYEALLAAKKKEIEDNPGGMFGVALPGKLKQLERIEQKLEESKRKPTTTAITERFPIIGKIDTLERTLEDVNAQLEGLSEDDPKRESLMKIKTQTENQLRERFREGQSPADIETPVTDAVGENQNREKEIAKAKEELDASKQEEKRASDDLKEASKTDLTIPKLESTLDLNKAMELLGDAPTEKTFEGVMKDLSNARETDFLKVVEENTNKMQDGIEKEKRLAIPMSLVSAGVAIASAPPGAGILGAITKGVESGFAKYEGLQDKIKESEKAFRDAQNALAMARDARQEGDIKTAREEVRNYENLMADYKAKQVSVYMDTQKIISGDKRVQFETEVNAFLQQDLKNFEMAKTRYTQSAKTKRDRELAAATLQKSKLDMIQKLREKQMDIQTNQMYIVNPELQTKALGIIQKYIDNITGASTDPDEEVEKKKEGGKINAPKNNSYRSVFDFT